MDISIDNRFDKIRFLKAGQFLSEVLKNRLLAALIFFIVARYQTISFNYTVYKLSMIMTGVIAGILILNSINKYKPIHYLIFILFAIQMLIIKNPNLLYVYFLSLAFIDCDMYYVVKVYMISNVIFFAIYMTMNITGLRKTEFVKGRNDFGYGNPNSAFIAMFTIWISYLYCKFDDLEIIDIVIMLLFALMMYKQTNTRTGLITIFAILITIPIIKKFRVDSKFMKISITSLPIIIAILSLVIALVLKENSFLNDVLSSRPLYWNKYLTHPVSGLNIFGHKSDVKEYLFVPKLPFDSGYLTLIYTFGIFGFVIFLGLYSYTIYKLCLENKKREIIFIIAIQIYAFAESMFMDIATNLAIVCMATAISSINLKRAGERRKKCKKV